MKNKHDGSGIIVNPCENETAWDHWLWCAGGWKWMGTVLLAALIVWWFLSRWRGK